MKQTDPKTIEQADSLDRILGGEEPLLPSSGFAASVMDAIEEQAAAPAPIPFPWKLAAPGIAGLIAALIIIVRLAMSAAQSMNQNSAGELLSRGKVDDMLSPLLRTQTGPALLALAAALLCMFLCRRLTGGGSVR